MKSNITFLFFLLFLAALFIFLLSPNKRNAENHHQVNHLKQDHFNENDSKNVNETAYSTLQLSQELDMHVEDSTIKLKPGHEVVESKEGDQIVSFSSTSNNGMGNCKKMGVRTTVRCPLGARTPFKYTSSILPKYKSMNPEDLEECLQLELPIKKTDPRKCWARIIMLPSYPTNGSTLARNLIARATGTIQKVSQYSIDDKSTKALYDIDDDLRIYYGTESLNELMRPFPLMGEPVFFKSHLGLGKKKQKQLKPKRTGRGEKQMKSIEMETQENNSENQSLGKLALRVSKGRMEKLGGKERKESGKKQTNNDMDAILEENISGVLRLARNPGDQILRNEFRWSGTKECRDRSKGKIIKKRCKLTKGDTFMCRTINADKYLNFHRHWSSFNESIPQAIWHYEHFSSNVYALSSFQNAMKTLNVTLIITDDLKEGLKEIIVTPDYKHGTVLAEICGKEAARKLHKETKHVSEALGYVFHEESATWSLPPPYQMIE